MEWGTESQNTRLEKIQSLPVNPESELGNFLYGDSGMRAVTYTSWAALKVQLLYTPAIDAEHLWERHCARNCERNQNKQGRFSAF